MSFTFDPYSLKNNQVTEASDALLTDPTALRDLEKYWSSLPRKNGVPERKSVDPMALAGVLEDCFILERVAPGVARIRVAGRGVSKLFGIEPRGLPLTTAFLPGARAEISRHLEEAFTGPSIVELNLEAPRAVAQPKLQGKILFLPLRDENGRVSRILGAIVMSGRLGSGGRRFVIKDEAPVRATPIARVASIDAAPAIQPKAQAPRRSLTSFNKSGLTATENKVAVPTRKAGDKPALRLIVNNT